MAFSNPAYAQGSSLTIGIAIVAFYLLDFSLNALQASLRNLLLDIAPSEQLSAGNAWHGRMTHAGNIIGYGTGVSSPLSVARDFLYHNSIR